MPVKIAQDLARQCCTSCLAVSPVIHLLSPLASAVLPSKLAAILTRTKGLFFVIREIKPALSSCAWASIKACSVLMPAAANLARPLPATCGLGSFMAATTRLTPALIKASAQGGVFPKWLQGSSVT